MSGRPARATSPGPRWRRRAPRRRPAHSPPAAGSPDRAAPGPDRARATTTPSCSAGWWTRWSAQDWSEYTKVGTVFGRWSTLVGPDIAAHCEPQTLTDGELLVVAESTAWATQLRLLAPTILNKLRASVGGDVVTKLRVVGPTAPSWKKGPRSVRGRGPRDTYG